MVPCIDATSPARKKGGSMKTILAVATIAAVLAAGAAAASPAPPAPPAAAFPIAGAPPAAGSVFAELADLGYDLGKFRPDYAGRFPYR